MTEPIQFMTQDLRRFGDKISEDLFGTASYRGKVRHRYHLPYQGIVLKVFNDRTIWDSELQFLTKCQQKNVVELIGSAADYPNGPYYLVLADYQNGTLEQKLPDLKWHETVKILKGIACFLKHIHTNFNPRIVHSDIQPGNIFLDNKYNPKISNFEAATEGQPRNGTRRSIGYMDPIAMEINEPTRDIYSFGIIMLQLITKEPCISDQDEHISTVVQRRLETINHVDHDRLEAINHVDHDRLEAIIHVVEESLETNNHVVHEGLLRTGCNTKKAKLITILALKCIRPNTEDRPRADVLVDMLDDLDAKFPKVMRFPEKIKCFPG